MTRRLRYLALGLFLLAPCVARCDDLPVIDSTFIDVFTNTLNRALFVPYYEYNPETDVYEQKQKSVFLVGNPLYDISIGNYLDTFDIFSGISTQPGLSRYQIWEFLENNGYGMIENPGSDDPWFNPSVGLPSNLMDVPGFYSFLTNNLFPVVATSDFSIWGNPNETVFGAAQGAGLLLPKLNQALDNINKGNFGGGNAGGGDDTIHFKIHGGVTNIVRILTNHFDKVTNNFNTVSNSLSSITNSLTAITNSVVIITNQLEVALDYLHSIATNSQQDAIVTILQFMTNNWPDVNISMPDRTNDVQDVTNKMRVANYTFRAESGPLIVRRIPDTDTEERWYYKTDEDGKYFTDGFSDDIQTLKRNLNDEEWDFGEVVTFCLQAILDKAQDIKSSLWILNHAFDTNSAPVDISELDSLKSEVDSFVQGAQGTLESAFYNVELDDGIFAKFKNNFVAIFGTVGRGPPMLRGAKNGDTRQTVWSFYVGEQRWDISLDSTLYNSSRRLCRMAASMVWCVLLWLAFRKILIRAVYWLVKCIDWCLQVFGFQLKWLGTIEEFLKQLAGIGPGG